MAANTPPDCSRDQCARSAPVGSSSSCTWRRSPAPRHSSRPRALPEEVDRLREQVRRLGEAETASERRRADTQFTIDVAAAAQSPRLTREEARLRAAVGDLLALDVEGEDHAALVRDRRQLVKAVKRGKPNRARRLAERHIEAETTRLIRLRLRSYGAP